MDSLEIVSKQNKARVDCLPVNFLPSSLSSLYLFVSFYKDPCWDCQLHPHTAFSWKASLDEIFHCVFHVCVYACMHTQHSGNHQKATWRSWVSPSHVSPRNWAQLMRFGDKYSELLSHLPGPNVLFKFTTISYWLPWVQPAYSERARGILFFP